MAGNGHLRVSALATLATLALTVSACGRVAAPGAAPYAQVIRDPDNPAWAGSLTSTATAARVIKDPDNPYWTGFWTVARVTSPANATIHDPDNPYWLGR